MRRYKKYAAPYRSAFIIGPLMMLTEVVGEIMLPRLMSFIINRGVAQRDVGYMVRIGLLMLAVTVFMAAGGVLGAYFAARASISFTSDLRQDVFSRVQQFSFKNIDDFSTGSLVTRLTNDIQQVQNVMMMGLRMMLRAPGMLLGALIMAFIMNARLAVIILIVIPLLTAAIAVILTTAYPRFEFMQKRLDALNNGIQEALTNVRVVKSFVREDYEKERFGRMNGELKESSLAAMRIVIATMPVMMLAMNVTTLAVVWNGGNLIIAGDMPVGDLTAFTTYIVQILMSLMMLSMVFLQSSRAVASIRRIDEVLKAPIDLTDEGAARKDAAVTEGKIEFQDVCFSYEAGGETVLDHINLTIQGGETVGIIGSTGSGKTSLVQLIPRLYDAVSGRVLVDGIDVRDYSLKHLREGVGMVLQKNVLFSGTILENLRWGDKEATEEQCRHACELAQAHEFIEKMPDGYQTYIEQGGTNVSGGQKQRLCIARALLKKPKILILDDSTSAVDTKTDSLIRKAFAEEIPDTTKLIIAQRISSVQDADRILVLDQGAVVGFGTHEELLKDNDIYRDIYELQQKGADFDE